MVPPSHRELSIVCACGLLLWAAHGRPAAAQPVVRVRASTRIALNYAQSKAGATLEGALLDDLDAPLAGRMLQLSLSPRGADGASQRRSLKTASDGSFHLILAALRGPYTSRVRFEGDAHDASSERSLELDLGKSELRLRFILPHEALLDLDEQAHVVELLASSEAGGASLDLALEDEHGRELARGRTTAEGTFRTVLPSSTLGEPGVGRLIARSSGDALRSSAETEVSVLRSRASSLSMSARTNASLGRLAVSGSLRAGGVGLTNQAIGLFDGQEHIASVLTDAQGRFRYAELQLPQPGTQARTLHMQGRFTSNAPWIGSSASPVVAIVLAPPSPPNAAWLLASLAVTCLLLWLLVRRGALHATAHATPIDRGAGIHAGQGQLRGRPQQLQVQGEVLDAALAIPVRAAMVRLEGNAEERIEIAVASNGHFQSSELAKGDWKLSVCAPGYRELSATLRVPHRGEWSNVRVQLASLRSAAIIAYKPAAFRVLRSPELWERWTVRETLEGARRNGLATDSFVQLTEHVERAAYARQPPSEADVKTIESTVSAIIDTPRPIDGDS